jgi:hypothetical protein
MVVRQLFPTACAAVYLGVSPSTLRSWRRRGIGPSYVRFPRAYLSDSHRYWPKKRHGSICYPVEALEKYVEMLTVREKRMPRPLAGRLPGGGRRWQATAALNKEAHRLRP